MPSQALTPELSTFPESCPLSTRTTGSATRTCAIGAWIQAANTTTAKAIGRKVMREKPAPRAAARRRSIRLSAADVLVEPGDGHRPRLVGGVLVVARRRGVVVEAVHRGGPDVPLVGLLVGLERGLVLGPRHHQASVLRAMVHQHRGLDLRDVGRRGRAA